MFIKRRRINIIQQIIDLRIQDESKPSPNLPARPTKTIIIPYNCKNDELTKDLFQ